MIPTEYKLGETTPQSVIDQNLRELCMYDSIADDRKSLWFSYINVVIQNCMMPDEGSDLVKPVTSECHDSKVLALLKTDSFSKLNVDWDRFTKCNEE